MDNDLRKRIETISKLLDKALDKSRHLTASYDALHAAADLARDAVKQWPVQAEVYERQFRISKLDLADGKPIYLRYVNDDGSTWTIDRELAMVLPDHVVCDDLINKYNLTGVTYRGGDEPIKTTK